VFCTGLGDIQIIKSKVKSSILLIFHLKQDQIDSIGPSTSTRSKPHKRTGNSKNSPTMRKGQNVIHGHLQQRLHLGLSSSQNRATSHYGAVTGLQTTKHGMYLLSSGMRTWVIIVLKCCLLFFVCHSLAYYTYKD